MLIAASILGALALAVAAGYRIGVPAGRRQLARHVEAHVASVVASRQTVSARLDLTCPASPARATRPN